MATPGANPTPKYRKDYKPVPYKVDQVGLQPYFAAEKSGRSAEDVPLPHWANYWARPASNIMLSGAGRIAGAPDFPAGRGIVARALGPGLCTSLRGLYTA
jgi:hypothetical protein